MVSEDAHVEFAAFDVFLGDGVVVVFLVDELHALANCSSFSTKDAWEIPYEASSLRGLMRMGNRSRGGRTPRRPRAMTANSGTRMR